MFEQLKKLIKRSMPDIDIEKATLDSRLVEDLGFDSLGMMLLAMTVENEMGIQFSEETLNFVTVGDVVKYLEEHQ